MIVVVLLVLLVVLADELLIPAEPEPVEELELLAIYTQAAPLKAKPI